MSAKFDFKGGKELSKMLESIGGKNAINVMRGSISKSAQIVKKDAMSRVPTDTGQLRKSIFVKRSKPRGDFVSVSVATSDPISHLIEFGVKRHLINQTKGAQKPRKKLDIGGDVRFNTFEHPGHPGMPFLRPAIESNQIKVIEKVKDETKKGLFRFIDKMKVRK
jgi:HK97 gp10 family phage protein